MIWKRAEYLARFLSVLGFGRLGYCPIAALFCRDISSPELLIEICPSRLAGTCRRHAAVLSCSVRVAEGIAKNQK